MQSAEMDSWIPMLVQIVCRFLKHNPILIIIHQLEDIPYARYYYPRVLLF